MRYEWKNKAKMGKGPIFLGLEGDRPLTIRTTPLHLSDDQFTPLIQKINNKIETIVLLDQFHTAPSIFSLLSPKLCVKFLYFIIL